MMSNDARKSVALVTGASLSLGKAIARHFARAGYAVVMTARSEKGIAAAAAELAREAGATPDSTFLPLAADVGRADDNDRVIEAIRARFGRLDVLVNNAGIYGPIGPVQDNDEAAWIAAVQTNLVGPFLLIRRALPLMLAQRSGVIINMSGGGATKPAPTFSAYAASKAGLVRMTETLALELAPHGIRVVAVAPGFIASRFHDPIVAGTVAADPAIAEATRRAVARGGDDPARAAELCLYLAGPDAGHLNGRLLSAVFDDRELLREPRAFASPDLFTLRRIDNHFFQACNQRSAETR